MSGNLFRFKFTDDSATLSDVINDETVTLISLCVVCVGSGDIIGRYQKPVSCLTERRESLFDVLRDIDNDFLACPYFDRDSFRVRLTAIAGIPLPSVSSYK